MDVTEELALSWISANVRDRSLRAWTPADAPSFLKRLTSGTWWAWLIVVPPGLNCDPIDDWVYSMNRGRPEGYTPLQISLTGGWKVVFS